MQAAHRKEKDPGKCISISLCMIVKNEERTLGRCLESIKDMVDEINIVDTGSTDNTKAIAEKYTDRIFDFAWVDDFAVARNFAFSKATKEYILWLDADDVIKEEDAVKFKGLKESFDPSVDVISMNYNLSSDSKGNVTSSLRRNRLVRRSCNFRWIGAVHEYLAVSGRILNADIAVTHASLEHDSDRNLKIFEAKLARHEAFTPRDLYYCANEYMDHRMYEKALDFYLKFLDTKAGWVEDNIGACTKAADCNGYLGRKEQQLRYILKTFEYDTPRAEACCKLGYYFLDRKDPGKAVFWYKLATQLEKPANNWGHINHACWTWLPHLQLCLCYDQLGRYELAYKHNELAAAYIPDDPKIEYNRNYFKTARGLPAN